MIMSFDDGMDDAKVRERMAGASMGSVGGPELSGLNPGIVTPTAGYINEATPLNRASQSRELVNIPSGLRVYDQLLINVVTNVKEIESLLGLPDHEVEATSSGGNADRHSLLSDYGERMRELNRRLAFIERSIVSIKAHLFEQLDFRQN